MEVFNGTYEECQEYVFAHFDEYEDLSIENDFISDNEELYCFVMVEI